MKVNPSPSVRPRTTGFRVSFAMTPTAPVKPRSSYNRAVSTVLIQTMPNVMAPAWAIAAVAMAFIGCTGIGVLK
jgi:hypothetical protein